jgi:hypothetical protein
MRSPPLRGSPRGAWLWIVLRQRKERSNRSWGSRGLAPLGCLPHWGREGVTLAISTPAQKTRRGFLQGPYFLFSSFSPFIWSICSQSTTMGVPLVAAVFIISDRVVTTHKTINTAIRRTHFSGNEVNIGGVRVFSWTYLQSSYFSELFNVMTITPNTAKYHWGKQERPVLFCTPFPQRSKIPGNIASFFEVQPCDPGMKQ